MKKLFMSLVLVGVVIGMTACTEEEAKKAADASFACLTFMLPAAQTCVAACLPAPEAPEAKLACEKTCVDQLVGNAGAMCGAEFGTEFKSEQFGTAVAALVKSAIMIYDATRLAAACPPCPCAVPVDPAAPTAPAPEAVVAPTNAVLPAEAVQK